MKTHTTSVFKDTNVTKHLCCCPCWQGP